MILIGLYTHAASRHLLPAVLDYWAETGPQDTVIEIVYNGRLEPDVCRFLAAATQNHPVDIRVTVRPTGHLTGVGPLRDAQEHLRRAALQRAATHLLFHELSRMPENGTVLDALVAADAAVVGALYRDRHTLGHFCVFEFCPHPRETGRMKRVPDPLPGRPFPVPGIGFGFTLIRRDVLAAVPFRSGLQAADSFFSYDARRLGFEIMACPIIVRNISVDDRPDVLAAWHAAAASAQVKGTSS